MVYDTSKVSPLKPILTLNGVHGKEGTSSCYIYPDIDSEKMEFLSCGKDGRLCRFVLRKDEKDGRWRSEKVDAVTCTSGSLESVCPFLLVEIIYAD